MENIIYKKYEKNGIKFEYKDYLTEEDFEILIKEGVDAFINGQRTNDESRLVDNIEGFNYNVINGENRFYRALCIICIKDYTNELFETIFNNQLYDELIPLIKNASLAYNLYKQICDKYINVGNIIEKKINELMRMIPDKEVLEKSMESIPKEWNKVQKQYNKITKEEKPEK